MATIPRNSDPRFTVILSEISGHPCGASLYAYDGGILIVPEKGSPVRMMTLPQVVETASFLLSVWTGMAGEGSDVEFFDPDYTGSIRLEASLHGNDLFITICEFEPHSELAILVDTKAFASAVANSVNYLSPRYHLLSLTDDDLKVRAKRRMAAHD